MADQSLSLLQIDNNKVGIGTARPTHKLHIYGSDASFLLQDPTAASLLTINGAGNGYINAGISLQATNGSHSRGMGIFMHDAGADTEWYAGTPYANGGNYMIGYRASIGSHSNDTAQLTYAKMTVKNDGNVGIGTTRPTNLLQLNPSGGKGLTISGSNTRFEFKDDSGYQRIEAGVSTNNSFASFIHMRSINNVLTTQITAGGADSYISSGSFGIGNTSPSRTLDVTGDIGASTNIVAGTAVYTTDLITRTGNTLTIKTSGGSAIATLKNTGHVGIGTPTPGADLHIGGQEESPGGTAGTVDRLFIQPYSNTGGPYKFKARTVSGASDFLDLYYGSTHIQSWGLNGDVGIGTITPSEKLDVNGDVRIRGAGGSIGGSTLGNAALYIGTSTNGIGIDSNELFKDGGEFFIGNLDNNHITFRTGGTVTRLHINGTSGNVGVGAGTPTEKLTVFGNIKAEGAIIAETFIVSSSISVISSNFSSGSTIFGDTSDDVHQFTGSISSTGLIHARGSNAFAIGPVGNARRIDTAGSGNHQFRLLNSSNQITGIEVKSLLIGSETIANNFSSSIASRVATAVAGGISFNGSTANGLLTYGGSTTADVESNLKFDGTNLGIGGSPDTQLHVKNSGGIELRLEADTNNSGQEDCFVRFYTDNKMQEGIAGMDNNNSSTLFSGNTENAMVFGTVSNLPTIFATNNTERVHIAAAGNVGIHESSPVERLDVSGSVYVHGHKEDAFVKIYRSGDYTTTSANAFTGVLFGGRGDATENSTSDYRSGIFNKYNGDMWFTSTSGAGVIGTLPISSSLYLEGVGKKVGIGTHEPNEKLEITDTIYTALRMSATHGYSGNRRWRMQLNNFGHLAWGGFHIQTSTSAGGSPTTTRLGIDAQGRMGIGSSVNLRPSASLHIGNERSNTSGDIIVAGYNNKGYTHMQPGTDSFGFKMVNYSTATVKMPLQISASGDVRMNAGKVGIGTDYPKTALHVHVGSGESIRLSKNTGAYLVFSDDGDTRRGGITGNYHTSRHHNGLKFVGESLVDLGVISGSGLGNVKMGIGNLNPQYGLHVAGTGFFGANLQLGADLRLYNGTTIRFHGNGVVGMNSSATTQTFGSTAGSVNSHFSVGGVTAAMMISGSTGNVGIGSIKPAKKLDVVGDARILDGAASFIFGASTGISLTYSGYGLSAATQTTTISNLKNVHLNAASAVRFAVSGSKVGIGTIHPRQTFTVASGRANFDIQNNYYGVTIDGNTSGNNVVQVGNWHNVGGRMQSGTDYHLKLQTHNFAHDVLLQSGSAAGDGFVGIGTSNATAKLDVYRHSTNFFKVQNESQLRANTSGIGFEVTNMDSSGTSLRIGTSATAPSFIVKGGTSGGNVGIGTGNPGRKFVVSTGSDTYAELNSTAGANDVWLRFANTGDNDEATNFRIGRTNDGRFDIGAGNGTHHLSVLSSGNVGIGTTNPQKALEVIVAENTFASFAVQHSPGSHAGIHFGYRENNNAYRHSQLRFQRTDRFANNAMGRIMLINKTGTDSSNPGESDAHLTIDELGFVGIGRNVGGHYSTGPRIQALLHVSASASVVGSTTASLYVEGSGSEVLAVDGTLGRLFSVSDNFSGSLFSANTISGTPVIEAFSDNSVHLGPFSNQIQVTSLGHISGSGISTASFSDGRFSNKVGIGTTNPGTNAFQVFRADGSNSGDYTAQIYNADTTSDQGHGLLIRAGNDASDIPLIVRSRDNNTTYLKVNGAGNIGINTATPDSKLTILQSVGNGSNYNVIKIDGDTGNYGGMWIAGEWANGSQGKIGFWGSSATAGDRGVALIGDGGNSPHVFINSGGRLGVNTTSPVDSFHVMGASAEGAVGSTNADSIALFQNNVNASDQCFITIVGGTTGGAGIHFGDKDDSDAGIIKYDLYAPGGGGFEFHAEGTERMSILANGNVGIGTNTPDYQLELEKAGGGFLSFKTTDTEIQNGDVLGTIQFAADDATAAGIDIGAQIRAVATDNYQTAASNVDCPTRLEFITEDNVATNTMSTPTMVVGGDFKRVGIGTIEPGYPLEVEGATGNTVAKFGQTMALHMIHNAPVLGFNLYYNSGYKFGEGSSSSYGGYLGFSTGAGKFVFATSNTGNAGGTATVTERVTLLNDGKFGIATNSPQTQLHVVGAGEILRLENNVNASGNTYMSFHDTSALKGHIGYTGGSSDHLIFYNNENADIRFYANQALHMTLAANGRLGLGVVAPSTTLHLTGNSTSGNSPAIRLTPAGDNDDGRIDYTNHSGTVRFYQGYDGSRENIIMAAGDGGFESAKVVCMTDNGHVGIGTHIPSGIQGKSGLHIYGNHNSLNTILKIEQDGASSSALIQIDSAANRDSAIYFQENGTSKAFIGNAASSEALVLSDGSGNLNNLMYLYNGNVGISDSSPSRKLDVNGTGRFTGQVTFNTNVLLASGANLYLDGGSNTYIKENGADNIDIVAGGSVRCHIDTGGVEVRNGALLIPGGSNTTPGLMFDSSNDGFFHDTADPGQGIKMMVNNANDFLFANGGDFHADGDVIAYSSTISDERVKTDVKTIGSAVDKVSQLRGVEYTWTKGKRKGKKDIGVIAQEVEKVLPEIVHEKHMPLWQDKDDTVEGKFKTVDYEKLTAVLVESIKEQQEQINQLKLEIEELKNGSSS